MRPSVSGDGFVSRGSPAKYCTRGSSSVRLVITAVANLAGEMEEAVLREVEAVVERSLEHLAVGGFPLARLDRRTA